MKNKLNKDNFEKYFFYGMENKDIVVKWIIINITKQLEGTHTSLDNDNEKKRYELDKEAILELIVQLERFTSLHDNSENRKYFYQDINTESLSVNKMFNKNLQDIKDVGAISTVIYPNFSGIFFNSHPYPEKHNLYTGQQYIEQLRNNPDTSWGEEVFDILNYLLELEKENTFNYYSLFLDSKYARAIDRNRNGITDDREIHEIRNVYRKFLKR